MKVKIRCNALIGQDFSFRNWDNPDIVFDIDESFKHPDGRRKRLIADGYGRSANYGNGAVFANINDLIILQDINNREIISSQEKDKYICRKLGVAKYGWVDFTSEAGRVQLLKLLPPEDINLTKEELVECLKDDNGFFRDVVFKALGGER